MGKFAVMMLLNYGVHSPGKFISSQLQDPNSLESKQGMVNR